jgi:SAM-dependent methyltransferase
LGCLARSGVPLNKQSVLEADCGTGNYLQPLHPHFRSLGVDFNEGMLAQARAKLDENVELTCGDILNLPYEDEQLMEFFAIKCFTTSTPGRARRMIRRPGNRAAFRRPLGSFKRRSEFYGAAGRL